MSNVHIMDHPPIQHKIGIIRREETGSKDFRMMIGEIAMLMCYEATRDLILQDVEIQTPICKMTAKELAVTLTFRYFAPNVDLVYDWLMSPYTGFDRGLSERSEKEDG